MNELKSISPYFHIEQNVSDSFNKLKGELFNLIEATIVDEKQADAIKGLIRGFANNAYSSCANNMRDVALNAKYINKEEFDDFPPMSVNPLNSREF